ncbi:sensor domain-containing diguanylate cyclase [Sphingomonas desiccabilis]|nr:sensor domain-containing diguanylate cyclase [Sphingomonas desiccabilis]MBB3912637.1 diguanylate cyclase (GGDEF)-like protein/PAS domain S-box-containing protein [Sphingomonas desiccabilis]
MISSVARLGLASLVLSTASLVLTRFDGSIAFIWANTGLVIAALSLRPPEQWRWLLPAFGVAMFAATVCFGMGLAAAAPLLAATMTEATLPAWLLRRWKGHFFDRVAGVVMFLLVAGVLGPLVGAVIAATAISLLTDASWERTAIRWFTSHGLGTITFTPLIMLLLRGEVGRWFQVPLREKMGPVAMLGLVAVVVAGVFLQDDIPLLFLPMLPMLAATMLYVRIGAAGSIVLLVAIGGTLSVTGHGPIHAIPTPPLSRILFFQFYVGCAALLVLPVSALLKQHRRAIRDLSQSEARFRLLSDRSADVILEVAPDGTILHASPSVTQVAGRPAAYYLGQHGFTLVHPEDQHVLWRAHRQALANPDIAHTAQFRSPRETPEPAWFEAALRGLGGTAGQGLIVVLRDISARKATELALEIAASTDPLTGLVNRRSFLQRLRNQIEHCRVGSSQGSVALVDLDHFKSVNDRFGHAVGDLALQAFARITAATIDRRHCLARIGGEEFAILLVGISPEEAQAACERLRHAVEQLEVELPSAMLEIEGPRVTASIGLVAIDPESDPATILNRADEALYRAKASGRNCVQVAD